MNGDKAAVKALLKSAADVNAAQGDGMTALHWAAMSGDLELAQMLVFAGANVRATTRLGTYTPLFLASQQGHAPVISALLKAGSDVKAGTAERHLAADGGGRRGQGRRGARSWSTPAPTSTPRTACARRRR